MHTRLIQATLYYSIFYSIWKGNTHKPPKVEAAKNVFSHCVYYWHNMLRWMFFIPYDDCTLLFLNHCVLAFFKLSVLKEVRVLRHLHKNITNTKFSKLCFLNFEQSHGVPFLSRLACNARVIVDASSISRA